MLYDLWERFEDQLNDTNNMFALIEIKYDL